MSELSLPLDSAVPPNDAPVSVLSDEEERSPRTAKLTTIVSGLNQRFSSLNRMLSLSGADDEDERLCVCIYHYYYYAYYDYYYYYHYAYYDYY